MPWYEEALSNLTSPPARLLHAVGQGFSDVWQGYVWLVNIYKKNQTLTRRIQSLEKERVLFAETVEENRRLRALLGFQEVTPGKTIAARVVANDPKADFKSIVIDRGSDDGVMVYMPVVGPRGIVGRIGKVSHHLSTVLLITDPNSTVDVMLQRSRTRALLVGSAYRATLRPGHYVTRLEYLHRTSDMKEADVVVTSGFDGIFPSGLPVGTVHDISTSGTGVFHKAEVVPFEDYAEVEEVLVLENPTSLGDS